MEMPERLNLAEWVLERRIEEGLGSRVALRVGEAEVTYEGLDRLASRFARSLLDLGVRREERVFLALPDGAEFAGALFGILKIGAVVVMVNPELKAEELSRLVDYCGPSLLVVDAATHDRFAPAVTASEPVGGRSLQRLVVGGERAGAASFDGSGVEDEPRFAAVATHRDDPAIWLFSGGTTGLPKAVVQPHRSFVNTTERYALGTLAYGPDDVTISVPKLFFGYATGSNLLFPLRAGGSAILFPERPTPERLFELVRRHRPTILVNVPTMVGRMLDHPDAGAQDLSCLRFATSAGEALPEPLHDRWRDTFGIPLLDGLGTAEMWHVFVTNRPGDVRPGTLGRVVDGFVLSVRDDAGTALPAGEVGRLWVRGGSRAIAYWRNMEKTTEAFRGEWFVGGDLVSLDDEGYLTYCGRGDDVLKVGGRWVAPKEVEACLLTHPAVEECAVVGHTDERGLVKPYAFVRPRPAGGEDAREDELKHWVIERLGAYKHPRRIAFLDEFPRTHLGKVDRRALRRLV